MTRARLFLALSLTVTFSLTVGLSASAETPAPLPVRPVGNTSSDVGTDFFSDTHEAPLRPSQTWNMAMPDADDHTNIAATGDGSNDKPDPGPDCPVMPQTARMVYEIEGLDLDGGIVYDLNMVLWGFDPDVDFTFIYNADTKSHLRVYSQYPAMLGLFEKPFADVACEDVMIVSFSVNPLDIPVYPDDTAVLFTAEGNYFKVGNFYEHENNTVEFDVAPLCIPCAPEDLGGGPGYLDD